MAIDTDFVPYASPKNVLDVIRQQRQATVPDKIDIDYLGRLGITEGSRNRVLQALRFIGIIDENNVPTADCKLIAKASDDQYPELLEELVRRAYIQVFEIRDPATATDIQLGNAFQPFEPRAQKDRMITLFLGLCREANIISGKPQKTTNGSKPAASRKPPAKNTNRTPKPEDKGGTSDSTSRHSGSGKHSRYALLHGFVDTLPENGIWTTAEETSWIAAITGIVHYLVKRSDAKTSDSKS